MASLQELQRKYATLDKKSAEANEIKNEIDKLKANSSQTTVGEDGGVGDGGEQPPSPTKFKKQISASNRNNKFGQLRYPYAILEKETDYLQIEILKYKTLGITPQKDVLQEGVL